MPKPNEYEIRACEDTGELALYKRVEHAGMRAWVLIEHEEKFWEVFSPLAKHFSGLSYMSKPR